MAKLCITSTGDMPEASIDPRFGRCAYFMLVDTVTKKYEAIANEQKQASGGAGIQAGQMIAERGIEVLLTGKVGPNACRVLEASGIEVVTGVDGSIQEVVEAFQRGVFRAIRKPDMKA